MSNNTTTRPKKQLIIGIDPDTQGSGWACINITDRTIHLEQLTIPKIVRLLQEWRNEVDEQYLDTDYSYRFVLENVWGTSHNRHIGGQVEAKAIAKTGYNVGLRYGWRDPARPHHRLRVPDNLPASAPQGVEG